MNQSFGESRNEVIQARARDRSTGNVGGIGSDVTLGKPCLGLGLVYRVPVCDWPPIFREITQTRKPFLSATIAALPLLIALSVAFTRDPANFLPKAGFYVAITVVPDYSKWCRPVRFIKPTGPQELGLCPAESYDTLPIFVKVIYDTSGL